MPLRGHFSSITLMTGSIFRPHPNDKKNAYQKITLSAKPETQSVPEDSETKTVNKKKKK